MWEGLLRLSYKTCGYDVALLYARSVTRSILSSVLMNLFMLSCRKQKICEACILSCLIFTGLLIWLSVVVTGKGTKEEGFTSAQRHGPSIEVSAKSSTDDCSDGG